MINIEILKQNKQKLLKGQDEYIESLIKTIENLYNDINYLNKKLKEANDEINSLNLEIKSIKNKEFHNEKNSIEKVNKFIENSNKKLKYSNQINKIKHMFLNDYIGRLKPFILSKRLYNYEYEVVNEILNGNITNNEIDIEDVKTLLIISFFYGFHKELINRFKIFKNIYLEKDFIGELIRILDEEKGIREGDIVNGSAYSFINKRNLPENIVEEDVLYNIKRIINMYSYKVFDKYVVSNLYVHKCIYDKSEMVMEKRYHIIKDSKGNIKYRLASEVCCEKCGTVYLTNKRYNKINTSLDSYKIYNENIVFLEEDIGIKKVESILKKEVKSRQEEINIRKENQYENNLNAESIIKKMGYTTTVSRDGRWDILKNSIIPSIGKDKVVNHIKFLVRMNKGRESMSNAVNEWEFDLKRLEGLN